MFFRDLGQSNEDDPEHMNYCVSDGFSPPKKFGGPDEDNSDYFYGGPVEDDSDYIHDYPTNDRSKYIHNDWFGPPEALMMESKDIMIPLNQSLNQGKL